MKGDPEKVADVLVSAVKAGPFQDVVIIVREIKDPKDDCNWDTVTGILSPETTIRFDEAVAAERAKYPQLNWEKATEQEASGQRIVPRWISA